MEKDESTPEVTAEVMNQTLPDSGGDHMLPNKEDERSDSHASGVTNSDVQCSIAHDITPDPSEPLVTLLTDTSHPDVIKDSENQATAFRGDVVDERETDLEALMDFGFTQDGDQSRRVSTNNQDSSSIQSDPCGPIITFPPDKTDCQVDVIPKAWASQGDALRLSEKTISNCPGAIVAEAVQQNIHKEKHVHVHSTFLDAMIGHTKDSIKELDERRHVETRATRKAEQITKRKGKVMITGMSKQGKTTMSLYLAKTLSGDKHNPFTLVELLSPDQWTHLLPDQNYIVILDDLLGKSVDNIDYQWSKVLKQILNRVEMGNVILIMTCADDIYRKLDMSRIESNVFDKSILINLCSDEYRLRQYERVQILEKLFLKFRVKYTGKELIDACAESLDDGFFASCEYFIENNRVQNLGAIFFGNPYPMILRRMTDIYERTRTQYFALLKVALMSEDTVNNDRLPKYIVQEIANVDLDIHAENPCPEFLSLHRGNFYFKHRSFHNCTLLTVSIVDPSLMVSVCPVHVLVSHTTTKPQESRRDAKILIDRNLYQSFANRLNEDLENDFPSTLRHDCFSDKAFLLTVASYLMNSLMAMDPVVVLRTAIRFGHTALVERFLKHTNLDSVDPETKHELLHEAFDHIHIHICYQLFSVGETVCELCLLHICSSIKKITSEELNTLFGHTNLVAVSGDVLTHCLKELFPRGFTDVIMHFVSSIQGRSDFLVIRESILYMSCKHGNKEIYFPVKEAADTFPNPDTLLSYASEGGCSDIVSDLLTMGANPNTRSHKSYKPLHLAVKGNHINATKVLLKAKAEISALTSTKENVLHIASMLPPGTKQYILSWLLDDYPDIFNLEDKNSIGWTSLHFAASVGNPDSLKLLIKAGACVSPHDYQGNTPLHCHILGHNVNPETVEQLLQSRADIHARNDSGETPLQLLVKQTTTDRCLVLHFLVSRTKELSGQDNNGCTLLHSLLSSGCNSEEAEVLLEREVDVGIADGEGTTVLHLLASSGMYGLITQVVEKGADVNARDNKGQTPLHRAVCIPNNLRTLEQLLVCSLDHENIIDTSGNTPLHVACGNSVEEADKYVQLLVEHQPHSLEKTNAVGETALHLVSRSVGVTAMKNFETLLKHNAYPASLDEYKNTPLHAACISCSQHSCQIIKILLLNGCDIQMRNTNMETPLHIACHSEGPYKNDVVDILVAYGSRLTARNRNGCTPTDIALTRGDVETADKLSNAIITGACSSGYYTGHALITVWTETQNHDRDGQKIMHQVCQISGKHSKNLLKELVHGGCKVNARDAKGKTPLHVACEVAGDFSEGIVKELLALGANVNDKDIDGHNALHFACTGKSSKGAKKIVQILVESKVSIDEHDKDGDTPLHKACKTPGDYIYKTVQALINYGANIDEYNYHGLTPCDLIRQSGHAQTNKVILSTKLWQICNGNTELKGEGVENLLTQGATLSHKHANGDTILHKICSQRGRHTLPNAKLVLSLGANPNAKNKNDLTPYDIAVFHDNLDVAEIIAEKQKTAKTEVKKSKLEKAMAKLEASSEIYEAINEVSEEAKTVMEKTADAVKDNHEVSAKVLNFMSKGVDGTCKVVKGCVKMFDFLKNLGDDSDSEQNSDSA